MRHILTPVSVRWISALITFFVAGVVLLFGPSHLEYPAPFYVSHLATLLDTLILAATFYAAIGLVIGKRTAWRVAMAILALSTIWESVESRGVVGFTSIFPLIALIVVGLTHQYYQLGSGPSGVRSALKRALIFTFISTTIGCAAFFLLASNEHRHFSLLTSIIASLDRMYSLQDAFEPLRGAPNHIIGRALLFILGCLNYSVVALALLKPIADSFRSTPSTRQRVLALIKQFSTSSEDYFKYFPHDKSYYFGESVDGCVAYAVSGTICVVMADPLAADQSSQIRLLKEFSRFCSTKGWHVAVVAVTPASQPLYKAVGLRMIKIGENAIVDIKKYVTTGLNKKRRNIISRFVKAGYTTSLETPGHSRALMHELQQISDSWLARHHHKEHQFAMGYFSPHYLQDRHLFVVRDAGRHIVAFANLQPNFSPDKQASIDLMRASSSAPASTMDFLFIRLIQQLHTDGWHSFDMGLAPLSGLEQARHINERGLHLLYRYTNRWFAFHGLRRFKDKFYPTWEARYLAYSGTTSRLPAIALAINESMKYKD
jgi:phosphatidylglycerol lysyltransferase